MHATDLGNTIAIIVYSKKESGLRFRADTDHNALMKKSTYLWSANASILTGEARSQASALGADVPALSTQA